MMSKLQEGTLYHHNTINTMSAFHGSLLKIESISTGEKFTISQLPAQVLGDMIGTEEDALMVIITDHINNNALRNKLKENHILRI